MTREQRLDKLKNGSDTAIWAANEIERLRNALLTLLIKTEDSEYMTAQEREQFARKALDDEKHR